MKPFGTLVLFVCVCFVKETLKKLEKSLEEATGKEEFEDIETIFKLVWNFTFLFCYLFRCSTFEQQIDFFFNEAQRKLWCCKSSRTFGMKNDLCTCVRYRQILYKIQLHPSQDKKIFYFETYNKQRQLNLRVVHTTIFYFYL